ncbi:ArnT family glycosyltransferase [Bacillota bacterium Lsc_1132]
MKHSPFKSEVYFSFFMVVVLIFVSLNVFYRLGDFPIYSWDEARHGINAYEMLKHKNFLINTYRNQIDYWNLKPPLSFWAIMAGYKIAGYNTLGLRLFSALSSFLTNIMVGAFAWVRFGRLASLISSTVMATSSQWLLNHGARTGDADALFVFLYTASLISLLLSIKHKKWLFVSGMAFSFAFLTKSWHAGSIILIIFIFLFITNCYQKLSSKEWTAVLLFMTFPIFIWTSFRFQYDQLLFFKKMIEYDLLHRSSTPIEGHTGDFFYYFNVLWKFSKYWIIILLALFMVFIHDFRQHFLQAQNKNITIGIYLWLVIPLALYTIASTKIRWYILPVYPAISLAIGALASKVYKVKPVFIQFILSVSIVFTAFAYEYQIYTYIQHPIPKLQLNLLKTLQSTEKFRGYSLFRYHQANRGIWPQNLVLAAELYGDLKIQDGDFLTFLQKDKSLLLLKRGKKTEQFIHKHRLTILSANEWGFIVRK